MSIVGFKAQNHPQQLAARGARDEEDDRQVTPADFAPWLERFGFTVDAAASHANALLPRYWTREDDGLHQDWWGERIWCNPPYSNIRPWVERAWLQWDSCHQPDLIVMLLPNNRMEQGWWQDLVEPHLRSRRPDFRCEALRGRMRFIRPAAVIGPKGDRPPFGEVLLIWGWDADVAAVPPVKCHPGCCDDDCPPCAHLADAR